MNFKLRLESGNFEERLFAVINGLNSDELDIHFHLEAKDINQYDFPGVLPESQRERRHELWKRTCFEVFFGFAGENYLELNVSPEGHWQAYEFSSYREGRKNFDNFKLKDLQSTLGTDYKLSFKLSGIDFTQVKKIQPAVVLASECIHYYAPHHNDGGAADFHLQRNWPVVNPN